MSNKRKLPADDGKAEADAIFSMRGKAILITGGAQGLGLEVARMASQRGARGIIIIDRNSEKRELVEQDLAERGTECLFVQCDVAEPEAISAAVDRAVERFGTIEGLVNAAGDSSRGDLDSTSVEQWDRQQNINLRACFLFTQKVSHAMRRQRVRGAIVNVASVQAYGGLTFCMGYAVAKAALVALTKNNAAALGQHGIRVNAVNMGW